MAAPLVSVIIAVYNGEASVARAIESVLEQDFPERELILIDDASTDSTPAILERYRDRARIIHKRSNHGLAVGRNLGVALATGDYVAFVDADDVWLPGRLAKTMAALRERKTATMAFSDVVPVDDNYTPLAPSYLHPGMTRPPLMKDLLEEGSWPILPSTVLIHRWAFNRVGAFTEEFRGASGFEDTELWFLLRELGDFVFVPEPLVQYRLTPFVERMRKYAPGFGLFAERMRERYGTAGESLIARSAGLYRWLLTVKGLQCLQSGDMRQARRALFCALRYRANPAELALRDKLRALLPAGAPTANGTATMDSSATAMRTSAAATHRSAMSPDRSTDTAGGAIGAEGLTPASVTSGDAGVSAQELQELRRAYYSLLPQRQALALMRRAGLLQIPPPPASHAEFGEELLAGAVPLALY